MKKLLPVLFICLIASTVSLAQQAASNQEPPYKRFPTIPPFDLLQTDSSTHLTRDNILKKHNTLIMFFSPDCPHCQHQTEDILAFIEKLKDVQIVMATYQPFEEMVGFYQKYQLAKYSNIKLGRDVHFFLPPYFKMKNLPYLALYDKKGNLLTTFEGNQPMDKILEAFDIKSSE